MRFRTAVKLSAGNRYLQREIGRTLFDVIQYQPNHLDEDDLVADDWNILVSDEKVKYFGASKNKTN